MAPDPDIRVIDTAILKGTRLSAVCRLKQCHWDYSLEAHLSWFAENVTAKDFHALAELGDEIVGYVRIPNVGGELNEVPGRVYGISTVIVRPDMRGHRLGSALVSAATKCIERSQPAAVGLLQCSRRVVPFYGRHGWREFGGSISCLRNGLTTNFLRDECAMTFSASATLSTIKLFSGPF